MKKLVSVIVPCFNAEKWLKEAIDSCLNQTYSEIEIIVIDDGSTDNSLEILKNYNGKIIFESGPNKGGNHARNRGFALSKGDYIQYLDADDYLLPEKIERQVNFFGETGADVVYEDWRYQHHLPDGTIFLDEIQVCGYQEDILESLLRNWWTTPGAILIKRSIVEKCGGWDENLKVGQDRDFIIRMAIDGAKFVYLPGCYSIYRKYGDVTVSSSNRSLWLEHHSLVLEKAEYTLAAMDRLPPRYKQALAQSYVSMASDFYDRMSSAQHLQLLKKGLNLYPEYKMKDKRPFGYSLLQEILGFLKTERIYTSIKKQIKKA
ncbi:MAG: glycosyltransferase [Cyanobacteriota bacterium]